MLDLRIPSGVFFALTGAILIVHSMILPGLRAPMTNVAAAAMRPAATRPRVRPSRAM